MKKNWSLLLCCLLFLVLSNCRKENDMLPDETLDNMVRQYKRTYDANKNLKILGTFQGPASSQVGNGVNRYIYFGE